MREAQHIPIPRQRRTWLAAALSVTVAGVGLAFATTASAAEYTTLTARHSG